MQNISIAACLAVIAILLAACNNQANGVRVSTEKASAPVITKPRSEPIFYNGKTYQLNFAPAGQGRFDMAVNGMSAKQEKDAVAVATSSLRYFACPDGKTGQLIGAPAYAAGAWKMQARCA
jgi:lipopolysaccharide export system protein LptC